MTGISDQLKKLDNILIYIGNKTNHAVLEGDIKNSNVYDIECLIFLEEEAMIKRTQIPVSYRLTQKGMVFILGGGYKEESKRKRLDRRSSLIYLLSSPLIAFISLLLSSIALYFSLIINKVKEEKPINFSNEIKLSFPEKKDTIVIYKGKLYNTTKISGNAKK